MKSFEDAVAFHGHSCGGLAIGYKASELAAKLLGLTFSEDEEVVCITETDSCTVDAIQVALGCTAGKGNLFINNWGKNAFSFYNRTTGKSLRLVVKPDGMPVNQEMAALRPKVMTGAATPEENEQFHVLSHRFVDEILAVPAENLFAVKDVQEPLPGFAKIYTNVVCSVCGEQVAEGRAGKINGGYVCISCMRRV